MSSPAAVAVPASGCHTHSWSHLSLSCHLFSPQCSFSPFSTATSHRHGIFCDFPKYAQDKKQTFLERFGNYNAGGNYNAEQKSFRLDGITPVLGTPCQPIGCSPGLVCCSVAGGSQLSGPRFLVSKTLQKDAASALPPAFSGPRVGSKLLFCPHPGCQLSSLVTRITFSEATLLLERTAIYSSWVKMFSSGINFWL